MKLANVLLIVGVLAWAPFLVLVALGQEPPIYPFLIVHLTGVIGGSQLRKRQKPDQASERPRRQTLGRIFILLGVFAWAPYLYQREILDAPVVIGPYLTVHLTGVLGGIALLASVPLMRFWQQSRQGTG